MTSEPDYRALKPPAGKAPAEYSYVERRAELFTMIERAGHYRNLQRSYRELARRYDCSPATITKDIKRINEWQAAQLGEGVDHELETLKTTAVQYYLENNEPHKAYYLMNNHYEILMEAGLKDRAADKHEIEHSGSVGWRQYIESAEGESE